MKMITDSQSGKVREASTLGYDAKMEEEKEKKNNVAENLAPGKCICLLGGCPSSDSTCRCWINHSLWLSKRPIVAPMKRCIVTAIIGRFESHKYPHFRP